LSFDDYQYLVGCAYRTETTLSPLRCTMFAMGILLLTPLGAFGGVTYSYDTLGRLSTAVYDNGKQITYNYDPAGNRTQVATANAGPHAVPSKRVARAKTPRKKHPH
jgi:YD repeat-containing protein